MTYFLDENPNVSMLCQFKMQHFLLSEFTFLSLFILDDFRFDHFAVQDTFILSNVVPQSSHFNDKSGKILCNPRWPIDLLFCLVCCSAVAFLPEHIFTTSVQFLPGLWSKAETLFRQWAVTYGPVYVISGSIFDSDGDGYRDQNKQAKR